MLFSASMDNGMDLMKFCEKWSIQGKSEII